MIKQKAGTEIGKTYCQQLVIAIIQASRADGQGFSYWVCKPRSASPLSGADGGALGTMQPPVAELRSLSSVLKTDTASSTSQHAERVVAGVQVIARVPDLPCHIKPGVLVCTEPHVQSDTGVHSSDALACYQSVQPAEAVTKLSSAACRLPWAPGTLTPGTGRRHLACPRTLQQALPAARGARTLTAEPVAMMCDSIRAQRPWCSCMVSALGW